MRRIETDDDVATGLAELMRLDPRLVAIVAEAGPVPLRRRPPGLDGLARIVVAQQISAAAATGIWRRFEAAIGGEVTTAALAAIDDAGLAAAGLSRPKIRTLRAVAAAVADGLDLDRLAGGDAEGAIAALVAIHGIGRWTAEVYLLFAAGHPDVWPGGDLALRVAVAEAFGLGDRPSEAACREVAAAWAPWRGVAARLFWAHYGARRQGREAAPR